MIINEQKPIEIINECNAIFEEQYLISAILWFANNRNVARQKTVFMYGRYPAVSIYEQKIHIHRLLWMWFHQRELDCNEYIHHKDYNPLNALIANLQLQSASEHQSNTNRGRKQSPKHIARRIDATTKTRYGHSIYEHKELLKE